MEDLEKNHGERAARPILGERYHWAKGNQSLQVSKKSIPDAFEVLVLDVIEVLEAVDGVHV